VVLRQPSYMYPPCRGTRSIFQARRRPRPRSRGVRRAGAELAERGRGLSPEPSTRHSLRDSGPHIRPHIRVRLPLTRPHDSTHDSRTRHDIRRDMGRAASSVVASSVRGAHATTQNASRETRAQGLCGSPFASPDPGGVASAGNSACGVRDTRAHAMNT
jgi:hypothetical protein